MRGEGGAHEGNDCVRLPIEVKSEVWWGMVAHGENVRRDPVGTAALGVPGDEVAGLGGGAHEWGLGRVVDGFEEGWWFG